MASLCPARTSRYLFDLSTATAAISTTTANCSGVITHNPAEGEPAGRGAQHVGRPSCTIAWMQIQAAGASKLEMAAQQRRSGWHRL